MQQCSEKAYALCPTRHLCGSRECATFADHSECAAFNKSVDDKPMTNADRIRAMSDEELVDFLNNFNVCDTRSNEKCRFVFLADCWECVLDWLRQPAEEKEDGN